MRVECRGSRNDRLVEHGQGVEYLTFTSVLEQRRCAIGSACDEET